MMEYYTTQAADVHNLWLQGLRELALRQTQARDMSRPQAPYLGKTLHEMWQHFVQGWELIFTPPPHQKNYSGAEAQQKPSNEALSKEHLKSRAASGGHCEIYDSKLTRKRPWQHLVLQRSKLALDPSERQGKDAKINVGKTRKERKFQYF